MVWITHTHTAFSVIWMDFDFPLVIYRCRQTFVQFMLEMENWWYWELRFTRFYKYCVPDVRRFNESLPYITTRFATRSSSIRLPFCSIFRLCFISKIHWFAYRAMEFSCFNTSCSGYLVRMLFAYSHFSNMYKKLIIAWSISRYLVCICMICLWVSVSSSTLNHTSSSNGYSIWIKSCCWGFFFRVFSTNFSILLITLVLISFTLHFCTISGLYYKLLFCWGSRIRSYGTEHIQHLTWSTILFTNALNCEISVSMLWIHSVHLCSTYT